jgi:hypothetical protein
MKEAHRYAPPLLVAIIFFLLLPAAYVGSYLSLSVMAYNNYGGRVAAYRVGGGLAGACFYPLEQADRRLRPQQWEALSVQIAE